MICARNQGQAVNRNRNIPKAARRFAVVDSPPYWNAVHSATNHNGCVLGWALVAVHAVHYNCVPANYSLALQDDCPQGQTPVGGGSPTAEEYSMRRVAYLKDSLPPAEPESPALGSFQFFSPRWLCSPVRAATFPP